MTFTLPAWVVQLIGWLGALGVGLIAVGLIVYGGQLFVEAISRWVKFTKVVFEWAWDRKYYKEWKANGRPLCYNCKKEAPKHPSQQ